MKIDIVAVGRVRGPMGMAVAEYERRCRRYWSLSGVEVKSGGAGGGSGVAPEVVRRAEGARLMVHLKGGVDRRLSLSTMTLPHDLARLGLLEQLYRAGTLRRNEPDHKGSR